MYEAVLGHPTRFRTVLVDLPGGGTLRFDRPPNLQNSIEGWLYSLPPAQCVDTPGDRSGTARAILAGAAVVDVACPAVAVNISFRVDNGSAYRYRRMTDRQRGPLTVFNGLRGCRELVHK
jgi:hypothetical protein